MFGSVSHFALLDNNYDQQAPSYLFEGPVSFIRVNQESELEGALNALEQAQRLGHHAVGYISYEFAQIFDYSSKAQAGGDVPLLEFGLFKHKRPLSDAEVDGFLQRHYQQNLGFIANQQSNIDAHEYDEDIAAIKVELEEGNSYQVNYTYEMRMDIGGCPFRLYSQLREAQAVPFGALLHFPSVSVLSRSPELFFEKRGERIVTRPMKGTERREVDNPQRDEERKKELANNPKQRAENLMIVDLLRNDLGRIAKTGSVRVESLFAVETYKTVHQMTSTISAKLAENTRFIEILQALFPCGSITGAPKLKTTEIINRLEKHARGIYCGAIGYIEPNGDMIFNVPIRTLMVDTARRGRFHIGGGVVYDSVDKKEYEEAELKAKFLVELPKEFKLIESLYWDAKQGAIHEALHLKRMCNSAKALRFPFDEQAVRTHLNAVYATLEDATKVRIELQDDGAISVEGQALVEFDGEKRLYLSQKAIQSSDITYQHKTSNRALYQSEFKHFRENHDAYDVLFVNERGEITEATIHNILLRFGDEYHTPPIRCGLLPGIGRQLLLHDDSTKVIETVLFIKDLKRADAIYLVNSVRGMVAVNYVETPSEEVPQPDITRRESFS